MFNFDTLQPLPALGRTWYLVLPSNLTGQALEKVIFSLKSYLEKGVKIRVLFDENTQNLSTNILENPPKSKITDIDKNSQVLDSPLQLELIQSFQKLQKDLPKLAFGIYPTNFFGLEKSQIAKKLEQIPEIDWHNYQNDFEYQAVDLNSSLWPLVKNLFLTSFGSDFQKTDGKLILTADPKAQLDIANQLPESMKNKQNQVFLVWQKVDKNDSNSNKNLALNDSISSGSSPESQDRSLADKKLVGAFSFLRIGEEIQLHYTAGKTTLASFKGKKLPILTAAMVDIWQHYPSYKPFKLLTFSNKDSVVSQEYLKVGFEQLFNRRCFLLQNKV